MDLNQFPPLSSGKRGLWHGGDYNPEQWPRSVWDDDARLMDIAKWNVATVGVFSWVELEPAEGQYEFEWLRNVLDRLHEGARQAILATPSAAIPAWMSQKYPEVLRVGADGVRLRQGNRVNYCMTSPVYREKCRVIATELAKRFGRHPALAMWHVSNEYGGACHCDLCAEAFRGWLKKKFGGDLEKLNAAYWTRFWGHTYTDWAQIQIPGAPHGETAIHGLSIDWRRFVSDQTLSFYLNEAAPLRVATPNIPVTTNFMGFYGGLDYWKFAPHIDVASWDSYPAFDGPLKKTSTWVSVAMKHDFTRSIKNRPFLLMECTPSASNWYPEMELKRPGMQSLEGLQAIAHGSDSVQYFQWRQSRGGQEKFHGAAVGHDGSQNSRVFKEVAALGRSLQEISDIAGASVKSEVGLVFDYENSWAIEAACGPRQGPRGYLETVRAFYDPLLKLGVSADFLSSNADFGSYKLIIAPMLYMVKPGVAERIEAFVKAGGTFVTTYWSGIADENDLCFTGGFPGPLSEVLGIWSEEIDVVYPGQTQSLEADSQRDWNLRGKFSANTFCDLIHAKSAQVLAKYSSDFYSGRPALTVNKFGQGEAYYVASRNEPAFQTAFMRALLERTGLLPTEWTNLPDDVVVRRRTGDREYVILLNLTGETKEIIADPGWRLILHAEGARSEFEIRPYGFRVYVRG